MENAEEKSINGGKIRESQLVTDEQFHIETNRWEDK